MIRPSTTNDESDMNKHTPGPWTVEKDPDSEDLTISAPPTDTRSWPISLMGNTKYYPWTPDNKADWLLIAAAPEMLEALQHARRLLSINECAQVDAAIAKATGVPA